MTKQRVANIMLEDVPWDGSELAAPLTLPGALVAPTYVEQSQITKPANPPAGKMRLYPKADGKYYTLDSAGVEGQLGGAGSVYIHPDPFTIGTLTVSTKATLKSPDVTGNMGFVPDNLYDIGPGGARPRDLSVGRNVAVGGDATINGIAYIKEVRSATGPLDLRTQDASPINFKPNGADTWQIAANGTLKTTSASGTLDIGDPANRVRNLYMYSYTDQRQINTPASPAAGSVRIYPKTDNKLYMLTAGGIEVEIGTGASGGGGPGGPVPDPLILENGLVVNAGTAIENLTFITVPGPRIRADMSSAPNSNRLMFESSIPNSGTFLGIKPSGSGIGSAIVVYETDDTANSPYGVLWNDGTQVVIGTSASGAGTPKGLSLWSYGEKWRISVSGHIFAANDNLYDIGAITSGRPASLHLGGNLNAAGYGALGSYFEQKQIATPSSPPAGSVRIYPKADGLYYKKNSAGVESPIVPEYNQPEPFVVQNLTVNQNATITGTLTSGPQVTGSTTIGGDLTLTGSGRRIKGDGSNATHANRLMVQSSVANQQMVLGVIPDGTAAQANLNLYAGSNPDNAPLFQMLSGGSVATISASRTGTAAYVPITISQNGLEKMRISTEGRTTISGPSDVALTGNGWVNPTGDVWTRYDTVNPLGHLVVGRGTLTYYTAAAGAVAPAFVSRFSIASDGTLGAPGTVNTGYLNVAGHVMTNDGANGLIRAGAGDMYIRAPAAGSIRMDTGGATFITTGRLVVGTYDPQWSANFTGNPITSGRWYQQANGAAYCLDITDCGTGGSQIVRRTPEGYITGNYINMTADVAGGSPAYVAGQNGDNYMRWYPKSVVATTTSIGGSCGQIDLYDGNGWVEVNRLTAPRAGQAHVSATYMVARANGTYVSSAYCYLRLHFHNVQYIQSSVAGVPNGGDDRDMMVAVHWVGQVAAGQICALEVYGSSCCGNFVRLHSGNITMTVGTN